MSFAEFMKSRGWKKDSHPFECATLYYTNVDGPKCLTNNRTMVHIKEYVGFGDICYNIGIRAESDLGCYETEFHSLTQQEVMLKLDMLVQRLVNSAKAMHGGL